MASITPSTLLQESVGSLKLHIAKFVTTSIDDGDTWSSGIPGIVECWSARTSNIVDSASNTDLAPSVSNFSTGIVTFYTNVENQIGTIFVLSKS